MPATAEEYRLNILVIDLRKRIAEMLRLLAECHVGFSHVLTPPMLVALRERVAKEIERGAE